jgi:hypothetical protein
MEAIFWYWNVELGDGGDDKFGAVALRTSAGLTVGPREDYGEIVRENENR